MPFKTRVKAVYPRECGGTDCHVGHVVNRKGLSPRVRGNLCCKHPVVVSRGSIPASAGEPVTSIPPSIIMRVYPRECGGTAPGSSATSTGQGLSPRVRGNLVCFHGCCKNVRSIPASAGEPLGLFSTHSGPGVYPRECGGTPRLPLLPRLHLGLSPRVRGNRETAVSRPKVDGSIPASAGEPEGAAVHDVVCQVYPRECGGTLPRRSFGCADGGLSPRVRGNPVSPRQR